MRLSNAFVFPEPASPAIDMLYGWSGISGHFDMSFYVFLCNIIKVKHVCTVLLYCYI